VTENGTRRLICGLVEQTRLIVSLIALWSQNGSFQPPQSRQFLHRSLFRSSPMVNGHESWVMTEKILSQVQTTQMGFLRKIHSVTLRDQGRNCNIRTALTVESLLRIERSQLRCFGHVTRTSHKRLARQLLLTTPTGKRPRDCASTR